MTHSERNAAAEQLAAAQAELAEREAIAERLAAAQAELAAARENAAAPHAEVEALREQLASARSDLESARGRSAELRTGHVVRAALDARRGRPDDERVALIVRLGGLHPGGGAGQVVAGELRALAARDPIVELCDEPPSAALIYEVDALMQGLTTLRPRLLGTLLGQCRSIKAKRLFLALAERHHHAWWDHLHPDRFDLGSGKRVLVQGGRLRPTYQITLPADLDEQLG